MALPQSAVSELLEAFRAGDGVDLVRESVRIVMQELIEAEASERIGAARYERTEDRVTERNGSRERLLSTKGGDVELRIPKLRKGSFFPVILEPRRRIDQALYAVVMEAYVHGVSTRSVDDLVEALGAGTGISKSEVSRICSGLDEVVGAFRTRALDHVEFPYVYLDATYLNVRVAAAGGQPGQVTSMAVVVATGIAANGSREILGLDVGDSEDEVFWRGFLTSLKQRGLGGVQLVISDQHAGLVKALKRSFQGAGHQRCRVHFARNLLAHVPKGQQNMVAAVFRTIFAQPDAAGVEATWDTVRDHSPSGSPSSGHSWTTPRPRSSPSPPSHVRTGPRSGPPTPSSGSTRRSSVEPVSWGDLPQPSGQLTYLWEQNDIGGSEGTALVDNRKKNGPLFRVFGFYADVSDEDASQSPAPGENIAGASPARTFPDMTQIRNGNTNAKSGKARRRRRTTRTSTSSCRSGL